MAMVFVAVSVRDRAAETFGPPFFVPTEALALRSFAQEVNRPDEKNPMFNNSEDFELYRCGTFDDQTGLYAPEGAEGPDGKFVPRPKLLAVGKDVKRTIQ